MFFLKKRILFCKKLQVQSMQRMKRTSQSASNQGSVTVEAALVVPLFLFFLYAVFGIYQVLFASQEIYSGLLETARYVAKYSYVSKSDSATIRLQFSKYVKDADLWMIKGGTLGVQLSKSECNRNDNRIILRARAQCKIAVPVIGTYLVPIKEMVSQKAFLGFSEEDNFQNGEYVYVAEYAQVYHTDPSCSHICLKIVPVSELSQYPDKRMCRHCMKDGKIKGDYVTIYGDCIHSDCNCSGLKRTVRLCHKEDVNGMPLCSKCAQKMGK